MKKIFLFISFFQLISCGYQPIFSSKNSKFLIAEINFETNDKISSKIINGLNYLTSVEKYTEVYKLNLNSRKTIETTSKDKKGNSLAYKKTNNTNTLKGTRQHIKIYFDLRNLTKIPVIKIIPINSTKQKVYY